MRFFQSGFTLLELLLAVAIGGAVAFGLTNIFVHNNQLFIDQSNKVYQGVSLNDGVLALTTDIKNSAGVASSYPLVNPQYQSSATVLILQLPAIDSYGDILPAVFDQVVYQRDTSNPKILRRRIFPNGASSRKTLNQVLLTNLSFLQFSYLNSGYQVTSPPNSTIINYIINVSDPIGLEVNQSSSSGQIKLKNL